MNRLPGFRFDAKAKRARLVVLVRGMKGGVRHLGSGRFCRRQLPPAF